MFPSEENTPKKAPVRGRGRRTSHTTPAASSLFEEDHEEPQTKADMDSGLAGGGSLLVKKEGVSEVIKTEEKKLERPVFPWQKSRQTRSQSLGSVGAVDSAAPHLPAKRLGITTTSAGDRDPSADPSSQLASFQEMLLQQQKQMQEQFALSLQNQMGRSPAAASTLTSAEEEKLKGEVKSLEERIKELTSQLQVEKSELQVKVYADSCASAFWRLDL